jgi:hypothetical protein
VVLIPFMDTDFTSLHRILKDKTRQKIILLLSEKGKLTSRLLLEFPENTNLKKKPAWWRKFWVAQAIAIPVYFGINLALYFIGYINAATFYNLSLFVLLSVGIGYMITHIKRDVPSTQGFAKP